jgi:hypothetical protein
MKEHQQLFLHEELLLLALKNEKGTIEFGVDYGNMMGGAALAQLLLEERVRLDGTKKNAKLRSISAKPVLCNNPAAGFSRDSGLQDGAGSVSR